jgi:hypothetical protein
MGDHERLKSKMWSSAATERSLYSVQWLHLWTSHTCSLVPKGPTTVGSPSLLSISNCFAHLQCVTSSYFKICDEEINFRYEYKRYWVAHLRAIRLLAPCLKNCLICSLPSGPLFIYFCNVLMHLLLFWTEENWFCITFHSTAQHSTVCIKSNQYVSNIKLSLRLWHVQNQYVVLLNRMR